MMKMKKLLSAALAAVCVFSLAACGGKEEENKKIEIGDSKDFATLTIGVQQGTTGDLACSELVDKDAQMKRYPKGAAAVQALEAGKLACVSSPSLNVSVPCRPLCWQYCFQTEDLVSRS